MSARDPLNFFSPYERLPAGHENQLTRALLLLLRLSPLAHVEWLRLVEPARALRGLPSAGYDTQRREIAVSGDQTERPELLSVFLAPERPLSGGGDLVVSDRGQVLDAIVDYGGELVVVVENKVFEADDLQAREINVGSSGVQVVHGQKVMVVLWRDLLEALIGLRERALVAGAEAALVDDFLTYVEDHFPDLGPIRTLALCRRAPGRIDRRLRQILADAGRTEAEISPYGPRIATPAGAITGRDAYLRLSHTSGIELALYPADTLSQAQRFYTSAAAVEGSRRSQARTAGWPDRTSTSATCNGGSAGRPRRPT